MPLPAVLAGLAGYAGTALSNPLVQQGLVEQSPNILRGVGRGIDWLSNKAGFGNVFGSDAPQDEIGDFLRQQYMQSPQRDFGDIRAEEMRRYQQDILPDLQQRLSSAGMGGQHSGAYFQQPQRASQDLSTRLAALQQQFQQQERGDLFRRLEGLSGLRGGDRSYGLARAGQKQRGAQLRTGLGQNIFSGIESLRGQQQDRRSQELASLQNALNPQNSQLFREGSAGIGTAAKTLPENFKNFFEFYAQQQQGTPKAPAS